MIKIMYTFNRHYYNFLSDIKNEFIYGAHLIALCGPSFFIITCIILNKPINIFGLIISYIIPFIAYSYNYQSELHKDIETDPDKVKYLHKRKEYYKYILFFYLLLTAIILVILNNIGLLGYFIIITAGGILYTIVFKELTRTVPGFKSFYVALIWAYHGTFFAVFFYNININILIFIIFTFIFLKSFVNVTFFDIKDIETDNKENLKTLPVIFGKYKTIIILYLLNTLSLILLLYCIYIEILPFYMISLSIFYIYTMYYLYKGRTAKKAELLKYSYIMADSEFILWPFILILGKIIFSQWV